MADIFISYKREDKQIAERLSIALEQLGFDVWWDLNLISGQPFRGAIRAVIDQCKAAIVLWSEQSVQSEFVMDEASYAHRLAKLCPARIDGVELPLGFGQTHTADLADWDGELSHAGFQNVVSAVEGRVGRKGKLGAGRRTQEAEAGAAELEAFKTAQYAGNAQALRAFLHQFPRGLFANFVRGQLETMAAEAPARAVGAEAPRYAPTPPPQPEPRWSPPPAPAQTEAPSSPAKSPPWALIAAGAALLVLLAVFWPRPANLPQPQTSTQIEEPARDVDAEIAAARREERERATRDMAAREQELVQQGVAAEQARQQAEREQATRDQAARDPDLVPPGVAAERASYDLAQLNPQVRAAVERARDAERRATAAAARARQVAQQAEDAARRARNGEAGYRVDNESGGGRYEGQWANDNPHGSGVRHSSPSGNFSGDRYVGGWLNNEQAGFGVYYFGQNANNAAESVRYEGEWASSKRNGVGVEHWRDGDRAAGGLLDGETSGPGVYYFASGRRYEGEWSNGDYNGYGVLWESDGSVRQQGAWTDDQLTQALTR